MLDSSAVLNDFGFKFDEKNKYLMTAEAAGELKDLRSRQLLENALAQNLVEIKNPKKETIGELEKFLKEKGIERLSLTDKSVIALAIELKKSGENFIAITDDYTIQNCLKFLKIEFKSVIHGSIQKEIEFEKFCENCGKKPETNFTQKECDFCGGGIKSRRKTR